MIQDITSIRLAHIQEACCAELFSLTDYNRSLLREFLLPWVDSTKSESDTLQFIKTSIREQKHGTKYVFTINYEDKIIGLIDLHEIDYVNKIAAIGYWLSKDYQNKGFMTLSCKKIITFAFVKLSLQRIEIYCAVNNSKSSSVAQRLGATKEGVLRKRAFLNGVHIDMELWSILKEDTTLE